MKIIHYFAIKRTRKRFEIVSALTGNKSFIVNLIKELERHEPGAEIVLAACKLEVEP